MTGPLAIRNGNEPGMGPRKVVSRQSRVARGGSFPLPRCVRMLPPRSAARRTGPFQNKTRILCLGLAACCLLIPPGYAGEPAQPDLVIKAVKVHVGDGQTIENPVLFIQDGRIQALGSQMPIPDAIPILEIEDGYITPGLIDANARLEAADLIPASRREVVPSESDDSPEPGPGDTDPWHVGEEEDHPVPGGDLAVGVRDSIVVSEQSSEVVPHTRVLDSVNLSSTDFERLVRGGVTTVYAAPDASSVIGPRGAILRTAGPYDQRVIVPEAAVKATIGSEPSQLGSYNQRPYRGSVSLYARRPNSRLGLTWVFRKAFHDAIRRNKGLVAYGADTARPEASRVLSEVLAGKIPLRIQARIQQDIETAFRLCDEFKLRFTLEEATEAYRCIELIQDRGVPVIIGPIFDRPNGIRASNNESNRARYGTLRALLDAGITTSLSAQDLREEDGLARQAMYAIRFGVDFEEALRAVTQTPASMLGLDDRIGTVAIGKQADLILWQGPPLAATSKILVVLVGGKIVVDRR